MKRIIFMAIMACCFASTTVFAADVKIGYVDMQRALSSSEAGKEAREQLAARVKQYQDELNAKQEELKKLKDEFEVQGALLNDTTKKAKEKDYQQKLKVFQRIAKDDEDDVRSREEESVRKIFEVLDKIVKEYGRKNDYKFIFLKNETILYADDKTSDLTDEIIKLFNASRKK
jgi:outer membrane protein